MKPSERIEQIMRENGYLEVNRYIIAIVNYLDEQYEAKESSS